MALELGNIHFTAREVAKHLKLSGWSTIRPVVHRMLIARYAAAQGINITVEELQAAADRFRAERRLYSAADTELWLQANGLTLDDFEALLETHVVADKIRASFSDEQVARAFAERTVDLDTVEISILIVNDEAGAEELRRKILEDGAEFMLLARDYSVHASAKWGGYVGRVRRCDLAGPVAAAVFGAEPGAVIGPFATAEGFTLLHVHEHYPARLNETTAAAIREFLFQSWLRAQEEKADLQWAV